MRVRLDLDGGPPGEGPRRRWIWLLALAVFLMLEILALAPLLTLIILTR